MMSIAQKLDKITGTSTAHVVPSFNTFGKKMSAMRQYPKALMCFEKALEASRTSVLREDQLLAEIHNNIAQALEHLERIDEAIYSATQATEIAFSALGTDHPDALAYQTHFDQLMRKLQFLWREKWQPFKLFSKIPEYMHLLY